jgi:hypothetical protein
MYGVTLAAGALLFLALSATRLSAGGYNPSAPAFIDLYQAFNDNYKQALLATHQRDKEKAWSELAGARVAWQMLVRQHYDAPPPEYRKDQLWKRDLTTIGSDISTAVTQAQAGDLAGAHKTLEPIRRIWLEIRKRNGVRWFGDQLTLFHDVMEPAVQTAIAGVTDGNIASFERQLDTVSTSWRNVLEFKYSPESEERRKLLAEMLATETQALANLRAAAEARDYANLKRLAQAVQAGFLALYLAFG